jgi:hypothetical protein
MKKSVEIFINIGFWLLIILSAAILEYYSFDNPKPLYLPTSYYFQSSRDALPGIIIVFYLFYLFITPFFLKRKKYGFLILSIILSSILIITLYRLTFLYLMLHIHNHGFLLISMPYYYLNTIILTLMGVGIKSFVLWQNTLKENLALEQIQSKNKTALLLLKAQINPHFLFNTINNIDILIDETPKVASEYLKKLSDILRYVLYETQNDNAELVNEITQIKSYIELQRIRTDNANYVQFNLTGELKDQKIAPMIFLPFIENAFKYSKNKAIENAISINFWVSDDSVRMICKNHYESTNFEVLKSEGLGIDTIKQRLNLLYPDQYKLTIEKAEPWFNVILDIKLKGDN